MEVLWFMWCIIFFITTIYFGYKYHKIKKDFKNYYIESTFLKIALYHCLYTKHYNIKDTDEEYETLIYYFLTINEFKATQKNSNITMYFRGKALKHIDEIHTIVNTGKELFKKELYKED